MPSSLEKLIIPQVDVEKKAKANKAEAERQEEARRQSFAPKSYEDWFRILYPSVCDGEHKIYHMAGHWRLAFTVGGEHFEIYDEYIPADSGTPTEGYTGHDSYWAPYLHLTEPGQYAVSMGAIGGLDEGSYINSQDTKRSSKERKSSKEFCDGEIKKINKRIASMVKSHLLKKDDWDYRCRLAVCRSQR